MLNNQFLLIARSKNQSRAIALKNTIVLGGLGSSGREWEDLRRRGDYVVLTPTREGVKVNDLISGKEKLLSHLGVLICEDLEGVVIETSQLGVSPTHGPLESELWLSVLESFSLNEFDSGLGQLLKASCEILEMQKAFVIIRRLPKKEFELKAQHGMSGADGWLSENLVNEVVEKRRPIVVANVVGSPYQKNKSIVGTGFLSIVAWPLIVREQVLGVLVAGSSRPHSGVAENSLSKFKALVTMASIILDYYLQTQSLNQQLQNLRSERETALPLTSVHSKIAQVCEMARKIATTNLGVLIKGEAGVGKELLARWIHEKSDRKQAPFITVNCAAVPSEFLESLLFGYQGSISGVQSEPRGKIVLADGGTLFLNEVGDLPLSLQVKLLRVLQEKTVESSESSAAHIVNVRFIAATHKPIERMVEADTFRSDLYFRMAEVALEIPPLRDRPDDIELLAQEFLKNLSTEKSFSKSALQWLRIQHWSGNVRELQGAVRRAFVLSQGTELEAADFQLGGPSLGRRSKSFDETVEGLNLEQARQAFTFQKVRQALEKAGGHRQRAADLLGITPRTLFRYLDEMRSISSPAPERAFSKEI